MKNLEHTKDIALTITVGIEFNPLSCGAMP
jgi:hypothetical protein